MAEKPKKQENYALINTLAILVLIYLGSMLLPVASFQTAVVISLFRLGIIALTLLLTFIFVLKSKPGSQSWIIVPSVLLSLYIGSLFMPFISPYSKYPLYIIKCGGWPIEASKFYEPSYVTPSDRAYEITPLTDHYFCTEDEAQTAGFNH